MNRSRLIATFRAIRLSGLALCLAACVSGCHKAGSPRLEGKWRGGKAEGVLPASQAAATQFALDTELDFNADNITVRTPSSKQSSKYKVVREDKRSIIIETTADGPGDPQTFTFDDERNMRWQILPGKTVSFVKE
ncbi:MAG: hypothetical protein ABI421_12780 [Polyangiaceae bacterium]